MGVGGGCKEKLGTQREVCKGEKLIAGSLEGRQCLLRCHQLDLLRGLNFLLLLQFGDHIRFFLCLCRLTFAQENETMLATSVDRFQTRWYVQSKIRC